LHHKLAKGLEEKEGSKKLMKIVPMEEDAFSASIDHSSVTLLRR
jgi:hypothetical protein